MREPVVAEFATPQEVVAGAELLRARGYGGMEAYTPFPVRALEAALGVEPTKLPLIVLLAGAVGAGTSYALIDWTSAFAYPVNVGGRPLHSIPADIPIVFEATVLFAALAAFAGALLLSGLPRLHHRVFDIEGFERTTLDRFFITIDDARAERDLPALRAALLGVGALDVRSANGGTP